MTESDESPPFATAEEFPESEGVEVLQNAAREMIIAARAMLDIAEEVVADPRAIGTVISAITATTTELFRSASHRAPLHGVGRDDDDLDDFEHIDIE